MCQLLRVNMPWRCSGRGYVCVERVAFVRVGASKEVVVQVRRVLGPGRCAGGFGSTVVSCD